MPLTRSNGLPRLFLIRHGDTDWADRGEHTGRTDVPLNHNGEKHALTLGGRLKGETFSRVFVSPLIRARRTCELAGFAERAVVNPDLTEWNYGDYEGMLTKDVHRRQPAWNLYRDGTPNGESPEQVAARADQFLELAHSCEGDTAAFSSGQIIRMIVARSIGLAPVAAQYFDTSTASIGILGFGHSRDEPVIMLWNDPGALDPGF
jgi:broad specificity phosphatase PhoE